MLISIYMYMYVSLPQSYTCIAGGTWYCDLVID